MSGLRQPKVFISYARIDGAELAQRLQRNLKEQGFDAWLDTQRIAGGASWTNEIEQALDACQVTLALVTPGSYASEICRAEQLRALRNGKRVIPLVARSGSDIPLHLETKNYRDFTDPASYDQCFTQLLHDIETGGAVELKERYLTTRVTYVTAPPTVANYIKRPEALRALRDALFTDEHRQPSALTALSGMGGIGKTVLAKALIEDGVVQQAFPDGVVWITVEREWSSDLISIFHEVGKALGEDWAKHKDVLACQNEYRTAMAKKAMLVVLDDIWKKSDLDPFLAESKRSRLLFTTRDASIARFVGAHEHLAQLMDRQQARELLSSWAGLDGKPLPAEADAIIDECGSLPLALSQIGAVLRGNEPEVSPETWKDTLYLLRKADLERIAEQLPPGQDSFFRAVEVSFGALAPEMKERYKALAVLLEDMAAPLPILQSLWGVSEADTRRISRHFLDRSLAQRDQETGGLLLHDLQLDYVRAQYPDRDALELIHDAVRLSAHVVRRDPQQFASQMVGRLLPYAGHEEADMGGTPMPHPQVQQFVKSVREGAPRPWLRPLHAALHPPGTALLRTLSGHSGGVHGVAVSGDGRLAVSSSDDKTLKMWDLESGRELRTLTGHSAGVMGVALIGDGQLAVSASGDETLKVWDLESGRELRTLSGHSGPVDGVAVSGDGGLAVSAADDKTLKVWDLKSGRELRTLSGHSDGVMGVALIGDGLRAVSASRDHTLKVWDLATGRELRTLTGHSGWVSGVAVSGDGRRVVSASDDRTLKVWDLESGRELRALSGHWDMVNGVAVSGDGRLAASASRDKTLKVWDLALGRELHTLSGHSGWVLDVAVSADGRRAVSASHDRTLKVWDLDTGRELRTLTGHSDVVNGVAVMGDGRHAVSTSYDQTVKVWDLDTGEKVATFSCDGAASCCAFAGERMVVAGDQSGRVHFLSLELKEDS